jgi:hypothetical protein
MFKFTSASSSTRFFVLLLFIFVLIRGLNLSLIQLPFEGWDEYQHLAVAEYIHLNGAFPNKGALVPESMNKFLLSHPHPDFSAKSLSGIGAINYKGKAWDRNSKSWVDAKIDKSEYQTKIYQWQHGPLYYHLLSSLRYLINDLSYESWSDAGRILNVIFAAFTILLWLSILRTYTSGPDEYLVYLTGLMVASNSLYAFNYAHIANDSLAILLFTLALYMFHKLNFTGVRNDYFYVVIIGIVIGLSVITKTTAIVLLPFSFIYFIFMSIKKRDARYTYALFFFFLGYFAIAGYYHVESLQKYGLFTGMQEALVNKENNKGLTDVIGALSGFNFKSLKGIYLYGHIHQGGWSSEPANSVIVRLNKNFIWIIIALVIICSFGYKCRQGLYNNIKKYSPLLFLLLLTWAAMLYHGLQTIMAWGVMATRAPYAMAVFPIFCLVLLILGVYGKRTTLSIGLIFVTLYSLAYYSGIYQLLKLYSGTNESSDTLTYVLSHHSTLANSYPIKFALVTEVVILVALSLLLATNYLKSPNNLNQLNS